MSGELTNVTSRRWRVILEVAVQVAFIAAAGTLIYATVFRSPAPQPTPGGAAAVSRRPDPPLPSEPVSLKGASTKGAKTAPIALIEYSDFQCPFCATFARETLPTLDEKYVRPGKVLIVFRHYPLPIHPLAQKAAEAAECAGQQGKFWAMHDLMFQDPKRLAERSLREGAKALKLNDHAFEQCLDGQMTSKVRSDAVEAKALGVSGTPAFLLGSVLPDGRVRVVRRLSGAQPVDAFESAIEKLLTTPSARFESGSSPSR